MKAGGKTSAALDKQLEVLEQSREDYVKKAEDVNVDLSVMIKELEQLRYAAPQGVVMPRCAQWTWRCLTNLPHSGLYL